MPDSSQLQLFSDTDPDTESVLITLLRTKQASEKLHMVDQLNASLQTLTLSGLRERHPQSNEHELKFKLAQLLHGTKLAQKISPMMKNI
jgi:hypothetical protein